MNAIWIGLALLAAAILDGWLILRYRRHTLPASLQDRISRLRSSWPLAERVESPVQDARVPQFALGLLLVLIAVWLFLQTEPYLRLPRLAQWLDRLIRLGLPPVENTLLGAGAILWGGILLLRSLRTLPAADSPSVPHRRPDQAEQNSNRAQAGFLVVALLLWAVLLMVVGEPDLPIPLLVGLWVGSTACAAGALLGYDRNRGVAFRLALDRLDLALIGALLAVGFGIASFRLSDIPASMIGDEGSFLNLASRIAGGLGSPNPFGFGVYSFPMASSYFQAAVLRVFGLSVAAWRLASVIPAVLAAVPTYLLAREAFDRRIGLLAGGILLTSPYFLAFARLGYNNAQSILPIALGLYCLFGGLRRRSALLLFVAGVSCGLGFYTYAAGRLGIVVAVVFLALAIWRSRRERAQLSSRVSGERWLWPSVVQFSALLLGWSLATGPHLAFDAVRGPELLRLKTLESLFPNVYYAGAYYPEAELFRDHAPIVFGEIEFFFRADLYVQFIASAIVRTALAFVHPRLVDSHYVYGALAGVWAVPFLVIGLARGLVSLRHRGAALVLLWFTLAAVLLSVINTFPPRHQHLVAVIPAVSILTALGLATLSEFLAAAIHRQPRGVMLVLATVGFLAVAAGGLHAYFVRAQQHFLPIMEDYIAFEALSLRTSRTLLYVYEDPDQQVFVPLLIQFIPNQADYQTLSVDELSGWIPNLRRSYTVFFSESLKDRIRQQLPLAALPSLSSELFLDAEGRVLGMAYRFGPGKSVPRTGAEGAAGSQLASGTILALAGAAWLSVLLYSIWRRRLRARGALGGSGAPSIPPPRIEGLKRLSDRVRMQLAAVPVRLAGSAGRAELRVLAWIAGLKEGWSWPISIPSLGWRAGAAELALLTLVVLAFSSPFLSLEPDELLPGNEYAIVSHPDQVLLRSLRLYRAFPLWDAFIRTGHPFVADPIQHTFNPVVTIPVLVAGVANGFKLAVLLSILVAAFAQWTLGRVLGFNRPARLWGAVIFALNGQAVIRFIPGHYNFIFGYAWLPLIAVGILLSLRHRRRLHYALTALSIALLYFSATTYYPYYVALLLIALTLAAAIRGIRAGWSGVWHRVQPLIFLGLLGLGLSALQILPAVQFRHYYGKLADPELKGSLTLGQALRSLVSESAARADVLEKLPPEEFYANIGPLAAATALLGVAAFIRGRHRYEVSAFAALLILSLAWAAVAYTPMAPVLRGMPILNQFRYPSRTLIFSILAVVSMGGLGLTWALQELSGDPARTLTASLADRRQRLRQIGAGLVMVLMLVSAADLFRSNGRFLGLTSRFDEADLALGWLRQHDAGLYYVGVPKPTGWHDAVIGQGHRYLDAWYPFEFIPHGNPASMTRPLRTAPNYLIQASDRDPGFPDAVRIAGFLRDNAYQIRHSLPYAFYLPEASRRPMDRGAVDGREVVALSVEELDPNTLRLHSQLAEADGWVVVRTAHFPGWRVLLDGEPAALHSIDGLLAARAEAGDHEYVFQYRSGPFNAGLMLSGYSMVLVILIALTDPATARHGRAIAAQLGAGLVGAAGFARSGVTRVRESLSRAAVRFTGEPASPAVAFLAGLRAFSGTWAARLSWTLFGLGLGVYLATRLIGLEEFPIYFFTDEAIQSVLASDFVRDGFRDPRGTPWPSYFENSSLYNLSLSVYLQVLPAMLLPRSVFVTRAVPAVVTLGAAAALALILKNAFRARSWWSAPLLLAIGPAWFLHSRTAFETTLMVSLYAWFLYFYLMYLRGSARSLYLALLFGALAFYSYSPGQLIVVGTGLLLLLADWRIHRRHWKSNLLAVTLLGLLALPYLRFQLQHPGQTYFHLRMVGSHWFQDLPTAEKLSQSVQYYLQALNPAFWFIPHQQDLIRHTMLGYAYLPTAILPLVIIGLLRIIRQLHSSAHRAVLLSVLAVPVGAAMAGPGITRVLSFVVPATLMAGLGLEDLAQRIRPAVARRAAGIGLAAGLTAASFAMLADALDNGPTWFDDYTLFGMQYGASQVFGEVRSMLPAQPGARFVVSPVWANGTHVLLQYFLPGEPRVSLDGGDSLLEGPVENLEQNIYVLTPGEYAAIQESSLFQETTELSTLPYPDARPGFYFLKLRYAPDAHQQFARQLEQRRRPMVSWVEIDGQMVEVEHSPFDLGDLHEIFDRDLFTLARTRESNPAVLKLTFPTPRSLSGLSLSVSTMELSLKATLITADGEPPLDLAWDYVDLPTDPTVEVRFWETPREVVKLTLEIHMRDGDALDKVHIYDLILQ